MSATHLALMMHLVGLVVGCAVGMVATAMWCDRVHVGPDRDDPGAGWSR
jgi:hypothetical protein